MSNEQAIERLKSVLANALAASMAYSSIANECEELLAELSDKKENKAIIQSVAKALNRRRNFKAKRIAS